MNGMKAFWRAGISAAQFQGASCLGCGVEMICFSSWLWPVQDIAGSQKWTRVGSLSPMMLRFLGSKPGGEEESMFFLRPGTT